MVDDFTTFFESLSPELQDAAFASMREAGVPGRGNEARLKAWWIGQSGIPWGTSGDFATCVVKATRIFGEHGVDIDPKAWCAAIHKEATGARPGQAPGERAAKESGAPMPHAIHEQSATLQEAVAAGSARSGRMTIQVITPGQGSSGYYSAEVCKAAAPLVKAGTPMYLDHPTESGAFERPERSLRDLAAVFTGQGRWDGDRQAVVAEAQVFGPYREVLTEMAPYIGVSVRGDGKITETARGKVVEAVESIASVDFVTAAGRGGKVLELLESTRVREAANVGQQFESRIHQHFTNMADEAAADGRLTREERITLSGAIGDALQSFNDRLGKDAPHLYQRAPHMEAPNYVPTTRSDSPTTTKESEEDTMPNIEESELARLREAAGRVQTLESERDTVAQERDTAAAERDTARQQLAETTARTTATSRARARVVDANGTLAAAVVDRIVEQATRSVPLTEAGALDETAFDSQVDAARTAEETYLTGLAEAAGAGTVIGLGTTIPATTGNDQAKLREANDQQRAAMFGRKIKEA